MDPPGSKKGFSSIRANGSAPDHPRHFQQKGVPMQRIYIVANNKSGVQMLSMILRDQCGYEIVNAKSPSREAISQADAVVVCWKPDRAAMFEAGMAAALGKPIFALAETDELDPQERYLLDHVTRISHDIPELARHITENQKFRPRLAP